MHKQKGWNWIIIHISLQIQNWREAIPISAATLRMMGTIVKLWSKGRLVTVKLHLYEIIESIKICSFFLSLYFYHPGRPAASRSVLWCRRPRWHLKRQNYMITSFVWIEIYTVGWNSVKLWFHVLSEKYRSSSSVGLNV